MDRAADPTMSGDDLGRTSPDAIALPDAGLRREMWRIAAGLPPGAPPPEPTSEASDGDDQRDGAAGPGAGG